GEVMIACHQSFEKGKTRTHRVFKLTPDDLARRLDLNAELFETITRLSVALIDFDQGIRSPYKSEDPSSQVLCYECAQSQGYQYIKWQDIDAIEAWCPICNSMLRTEPGRETRLLALTELEKLGQEVQTNEITLFWKLWKVLDLAEETEHAQSILKVAHRLGLQKPLGQSNPGDITGGD
ncbi:MAG: hypothetical protein ACREIQ_06030, partial [Nitrospiria bacterium]